MLHRKVSSLQFWAAHWLASIGSVDYSLGGRRKELSDELILYLHTVWATIALTNDDYKFQITVNDPDIWWFSLIGLCAQASYRTESLLIMVQMAERGKSLFYINNMFERKIDSPENAELYNRLLTVMRDPELRKQVIAMSNMGMIFPAKFAQDITTSPPMSIFHGTLEEFLPHSSDALAHISFLTDNSVEKAIMAENYEILEWLLKTPQAMTWISSGGSWYLTNQSLQQRRHDIIDLCFATAKPYGLSICRVGVQESIDYAIKTHWPDFTDENAQLERVTDMAAYRRISQPLLQYKPSFCLMGDVLYVICVVRGKLIKQIPLTYETLKYWLTVIPVTRFDQHNYGQKQLLDRKFRLNYWMFELLCLHGIDLSIFDQKRPEDVYFNSADLLYLLISTGMPVCIDLLEECKFKFPPEFLSMTKLMEIFVENEIQQCCRPMLEKLNRRGLIVLTIDTYSDILRGDTGEFGRAMITSCQSLASAGIVWKLVGVSPSPTQNASSEASGPPPIKRVVGSKNEGRGDLGRQK